MQNVIAVVEVKDVLILGQQQKAQVAHYKKTYQWDYVLEQQKTKNVEIV